MTKLPAASFADSIYALEQMFGWNGGVMRVELLAERIGYWHVCGVSGSGARLARSVRWHDERLDTEIRLRVPWRAPDAGGVSMVCAAWVRVTGTQQLRWAYKFKPLPSMVLQEGSGTTRLLIWALERAVFWPEAKAINRRLAYKFGAVQRHGDPDVLSIPAPGTLLREDRARPAPVRVTRLSTETFMPEVFAVSKWLKDPPEQTWMSG